MFVLRLTSNLIMTRLLMPEAFGLLAFAMTFATAVALLTDIGIHQSIVREKDQLGPRFLRTAWTVKIVRSAVISGGVLVMAGLFGFIGPVIGQPGSVMMHPQMPFLIAMTAVAPLSEGLVSTNWDVAIRRLQYKRIVLLDIISTLCRILFQIGFALLSPTVWALLAGTLLGGFVKVILSHLFVPGPRMRFTWDKTIIQRLWMYGKWIMGSSMLTFVANNTEKFIFGALVSSVSMGLYVIAFIWVEAGLRVIGILSNTLGFSMISEIIRDRPDEARRLIRKYQMAVDGFCLTGFLLLAFSGQLLVQVLYTPEYLRAGAIIQLLSPLLLSVRFSQLTNVILAGGDSRATFRMTAMIAVATVVFVLAGLHSGGFYGAITGMVLARFVAVPYLLIKTVSFFGRKQTLYDAAVLVGSVTVTGLIYLWV